MATNTPAPPTTPDKPVTKRASKKDGKPVTKRAANKVAALVKKAKKAAK